MIGSILQRLIDEKKTNVNELSRQINVSPQTLYSIIKRDNMKIDFEVLLKICTALGVEVEVFYCDYITHEAKKDPTTLSDEAFQVAQSYECASLKEKNTVRCALGLSPSKTIYESIGRDVNDTVDSLVGVTAAINQHQPTSKK